MSIDDQLFKQDGTLLTRVDIAILKFARAVASFLFSNPDDETFDPALRRMIRLSGALTLVGGILLGVIGVPVVPPIAILTGIVELVSSWAYECEGTGTCVDRRVKVRSLLIFLLPTISGAIVPLGVVFGQPLTLHSTSFLVFCVGFWLYELAVWYVARLGMRPPKRRKVEDYKLNYGQN